MSVLSLYAPPGGGGVIGVYQNLRKGLAPLGVDLRWLGCGKQAWERLETSGRAAEWLEEGEMIGRDLVSERERSQAYYDRIVELRPDAVLFHALCGAVECTLARYLPEEIAKLQFVHNLTASTYRAAAAIRDWVHATIGVSPRVRQDLVDGHRFPPEWTSCHPNGIDTSAFLGAQRQLEDSGPLRILSLGRLEDMSKGILWIPSILRAVKEREVEFTLTVGGDGPDREKLKRRLDGMGLNGRVQYLGWVQRDDVPALMARHEVLLFPSRFEGLPLGLVEAMAAGCVPVASRIRGVTDYVVQDGKTGMLFGLGDVGQAAECLVVLDRDRGRLAAMRAAGRSDAAERFRAEEQAEAVAGLLNRIRKQRPKVKHPSPMAEWKMARGLRPAWWTSLPEPVKKHLRVWRERMGS